MSDIAERLKKLATAQTIAPSSVYANICGEAASFIESQRGAFRGADQRITSLEADNARLKAEAEWKDIASAPRDGTRVQIAWPGGQCSAYWCESTKGLWGWCVV